MSAELDATTGSTAMAYRGETPWHGLGEVIPTEMKDPMEILRLAHLDWNVSLRPAVYLGANGKQYPTRHQVIVRDDTEAPLGMAGKIYRPIQNEQVLRFFSEYADTGELEIETVGSLMGGKIIWALAKMPMNFSLPGNDLVNGYVLLSNPHMYGKAATAKFTAIRTVCWNTLSAALRGGGGTKIWHTREWDESRQQQVKQQLGIAREQMERAKIIAELLASITVPVEDATTIAEAVFGERAAARIVSLYNGAGIGSTLESSAGTAWGLVNGATQFLDWERGRSQDSRLFHSWFGGGETQKLEIIREIAAESGNEILSEMTRQLAVSA